MDDNDYAHLENYNNLNNSQNNQRQIRQNNPQSSHMTSRNFIAENRNKIKNNEIQSKPRKENVKDNPTNKKNYGKIPN